MIKKEPVLTDNGLWWLLVRVWFAIFRLRQLELAQFNLTVEQSSILAILLRNRGSMTAKEMENVTMRQQNSISTLVNRMTGAGLLKKERNPEEKRYRIFITQEGRDVFAKVPVTSLRKAFSCLTDEEKKNFAGYSHALHSKSRDLLGVSYQPPFLQQNDQNKPEESEEPLTQDRVSSYELWSSLDAAGFVISRLQVLELAQFGITQEQYLVLSILGRRQGSTTTKDLEIMMMRQHHSISTLINRMSLSKLVDKEKHAGEKRYRIFMTEEGKALYGRVTTTSIEMVFSCLTDEEKKQFSDYLRLLHSNVRQLLNVS
jgi:DNA-binding MarR family transcriptional regulator